MKYFTRFVPVMELIYTPEIKELQEWLKMHAAIAYHDNVMNEDIYDIEMTLEMISDNVLLCNPTILAQLDKIKSLAKKRGTCYIQPVTD